MIECLLSGAVSSAVPTRMVVTGTLATGGTTARTRTTTAGRPSTRRTFTLGEWKMMSSVEPIPPEALLDDFPPPMQTIAHALREVVRTAMPDAIERVRPGWRLIGYDLPLGKRRVYFAYVAPEVEHVHLGFEHGWAMRDPHRLLHGEGVTKQVRWLTFREGDDIDVDRCVALVREAARVAVMTRGERILRAMNRAAVP